MKDKKCYVLIVSRFFPKGHPREGKETGFVESIINGSKIHTIRGNYKYWKERVDKINAGEAYLSVRYWSGIPYRSPQVPFIEFSSIGIQQVSETLNNGVLPVDIAENDGLTTIDMYDWFKGEDISPHGIIHFTDFRYGDK